MVNIKDFTEGTSITEFLLIKDFAIRTSSNGKDYADLTLIDKTGSINAKVWDLTSEVMQELSLGEIVKVRADVTMFKNSLQLRIKKIRKANEDDTIEKNDLVPSAPIRGVVLADNVMNYIKEINDAEIMKLTETIFNSKRDKLMYYPAAKVNHHSIMSGLLYHTYTMLQTAEALCNVYKDINKDFVIAGVVLHDICKINEMDSDEIGIVSDYTKEGYLLGHIIIGVNEIEVVGRQLEIDKEKIMMLQHMILSHHYEPEFGSPKRPMFLEAEILHYLDVLDTRIYDFKHETEKIKKGEFSQHIYSLHGRKLYRPTF